MALIAVSLLWPASGVFVRTAHTNLESACTELNFYRSSGERLISAQKRRIERSKHTLSSRRHGGARMSCTVGDLKKEKRQIAESRWKSIINDCMKSTASCLVLPLTAALLLTVQSDIGLPSAAAGTLLDQPVLSSSAFKEPSVPLPPIPKEFPPLGSLTLPEYEQVTLPNGLRVFLLEDHELGLVGGQLLVRGGGKLEPAEKVGLAGIAGAVQRSGGSVNHPAKDLDAALESMAARIEAGASVSEMSVGFRCLREDLSDVFSLFAEVVRQPGMPEDKLALAKSQVLGGIARRNDNPGGIAGRELPKLLYGPQSVYARTPEAATVTPITRADLVSFHEANFRPDGAVLGIWGDFDSAAARALVESRFGDWARAASSSGATSAPGVATIAATSVASSDVAAPTREEEAGLAFVPPAIYLVDRPGLSQGYVRMAELGTTLDDPDAFALDVLNSVLNSFGGRLFDQVRSREGLAYSVYGAWSPSVKHRGAFLAGGETRIESVPQFVTAVRRVLTQLTLEAPTPEELAQAKDAALNTFVFNFADSGSQLSRIMTYELFGIDQDYVFKYKKAIENMTAEQVLRAAQTHLHPDKQPILLVTDVGAVRSSLASLGLPLVDVKID
eukprot:jgi/Mesen1/5966/ME000301S05093